MEKLNFSDCTLARMEDTFGLIPTDYSQTLAEWMATEHELTDFDKESVRRLCDNLQKNVLHWNEYDLSLHFVGPMFSLVGFTEKLRFNLFAQRSIFATVQGIELGGRTDELIASGFRSPKIPFFAFNEYKKETDPDGDPAGQALAAMLVGQALNKQQQGADFPIYGCYIIGRNWFFIVLEDNQYTISKAYQSTEIDSACQVLRILLQLKVYCMTRTAHIVVQ